MSTTSRHAPSPHAGAAGTSQPAGLGIYSDGRFRTGPAAVHAARPGPLNWRPLCPELSARALGTCGLVYMRCSWRWSAWVWRGVRRSSVARLLPSRSRRPGPGRRRRLVLPQHTSWLEWHPVAQASPGRAAPVRARLAEGDREAAWLGAGKCGLAACGVRREAAADLGIPERRVQGWLPWLPEACRSCAQPGRWLAVPGCAGPIWPGRLHDSPGIDSNFDLHPTPPFSHERGQVGLFDLSPSANVQLKGVRDADHAGAAVTAHGHDQLNDQRKRAA
jgi:hypothetical protein